MADYNKIILMGRLTRDPELKYLPSGMAVATIGLAVNNSYTGKDGNRVDDTLFIDVTVFGKQAENIHKYLKKGSGILVDGRLRYRTWESSDGSRRSKHEIVAQRILFTSQPRTTSKESENIENPVEEDDIPF